MLGLSEAPRQARNWRVERRPHLGVRQQSSRNAVSARVLDGVQQLIGAPVEVGTGSRGKRDRRRRDDGDRTRRAMVLDALLATTPPNWQHRREQTRRALSVWGQQNRESSPPTRLKEEWAGKRPENAERRAASNRSRRRVTPSPPNRPRRGRALRAAHQGVRPDPGAFGHASVGRRSVRQGEFGHAQSTRARSRW